MPEVMEVYRMAGEVDYLLKIAVPNIAAYDAFYRAITAAVASWIARRSSSSSTG